MKISRCLFIVPALAITTTALAVPIGPSGRYYVTDESGFNEVWQFQGSTFTSFSTTTSGADGPIVVDGNTSTVRSVSGGFSGGGSGFGSEYDFGGSVLGTPNSLTLDFSSWSGYGRVVDAAFDGTDAYIVSGLFGDAGVFRYNGDFSGPGTRLFDIPDFPQSTSQGITYDTTTDTIWTSDYNLGGGVGFLRQWSLAGDELFSFEVTDDAGINSERNTALAYDFSDDTFWLNAHVEDTLGFGFGELWQFDRSGDLLQKIHGRQYDATSPSNILYWGGEILATGEPNQPTRVPEPSILLLLGAGVAAFGLGALRRRNGHNPLRG